MILLSFKINRKISIKDIADNPEFGIFNCRTKNPNAYFYFKSTMESSFKNTRFDSSFQSTVVVKFFQISTFLKNPLEFGISNLRQTILIRIFILSRSSNFHLKILSLNLISGLEALKILSNFYFLRNPLESPTTQSPNSNQFRISSPVLTFSQDLL